MERVACETKTVQGRYSTLLSRGEANSASSSRVVEMFMLSKVANALVVMWTFIGNILVYFLKFSQKKMKSVRRLFIHTQTPFVYHIRVRAYVQENDCVKG